MRKSGILLPVTSLPSEYGTGCFSASAYNFIDWLKEAGQSFWQILPLGHTGFGDSPYQCFSTFAGNPYMISLKEFIKEGLLTKKECDEACFSVSETRIDYKLLYENRYPVLRKAFERSNLEKNPQYQSFIKENGFWLEDYSLFMALKKEFEPKPWNEWDEDIRFKKSHAMEEYKEKLKEEIRFHFFLQFNFYSQWKKLKDYANKKGISIIGDIPIYVSYDSADVWSAPALFQLDRNLSPTFVAGCPPDGFSAEGQLWGNPLYAWETHKSTNYKWWKKRISHALTLYDVLRIDHFRGFDEYYSIKYKSTTAKNGEWKKGPGAELFQEACRFTNIPPQKSANTNSHVFPRIIAEDLGFVTDSVKELLSECGFPGMKVLEFAFDSRDSGSSNDYLPHNYPKNCVAYTGTHDNQTIYSWFKTISENEKKAVRNYLCDNYTPDDKLYKPLISLIMRSSACLCIVPLQDWLNLSDEARINTPSTLGENWKWRLKREQLDEKLQKEIFDMTKTFGRL